MMNQSQKDRAEKKVQIAIDKIVDLKSDFDISSYSRNRCERILDELRSLEAMILSEPTRTRR